MSSTNGKSIPPLSEADQRRFWSKVALPGENECLEWAGAKNSDGYGYFYLGGSMYRVHRIAWTLAEGPVPAGLVLDHRCRNRACVNPLHLEVVDQRENVLRGESPSAKHATRTHCPAGHAYDEVNTYRDSRGRRYCRTCDRERKRARRLRERLTSVDSTEQLPMPTTSHTGLDAS